MRLPDAQNVRRLKPRQRSRATVVEQIPRTIALGRWVVLACADDTLRVREGFERNNCRSSRALTISGPAVPPPPPPPSPPPPAVSLCDRTSGTAWYVKKSGGGAGNGTSWADAWTSFAAINWGAIAPGDRLYIDGGATSVTYSETWQIGRSGAAGSSILICPGQDAGHNGVAVFDYAARSPGATAIGIDFDGHDYIDLSGNYKGARHIEVNNLYNTSSGTASGGVGDSNGGAGHNTVDMIRFVNDGNPVRLNSPGPGVRVQNNLLEGVRGDAAIGLAGSTGGLDTSFVTGNYIETVAEPTNFYGPDGVQNGSGITIANNTFKQVLRSLATSDQHPDSIQNQGDNTRVYGNTFINVGDSNFDFDTFADGAPHDIYIYDNLFRIVDKIDPYPDFIRLYHSAGSQPASIRNFVIANNLFADANDTGGIPPVNICYYDPCGSPPTSGDQISNNIFVNDGDASGGSILNLSANAGSGWTASHNVYYGGGGHIQWKGTTYTAAGFVTDVDTSGRTTLPAFVSYSPKSAGNDFHLTAGDTVARDTGLNLASLFTVDADGVSRPQGVAWTAGRTSASRATTLADRARSPKAGVFGAA